MFSLFKRVTAILANTKGNVALLFGLAAPAMMMAGALGIDYIQLSRKQANLQKLADLAAIAGAHELPLANSDSQVISAVAQNNIKANLGAKSAGFTSVVTVNKEFTQVNVEIKEVWQPTFAHFFDNKVTPVIARAQASVYGTGFICVVGLNETPVQPAVHMEHKARISAPNCGIYSNAPSKVAILMQGQAKITAKTVCSTGGVSYILGSNGITPPPLTDCPKVNDPLADRVAPVFGGCDFKNVKIGAVAPPARIETSVEAAFWTFFKQPKPTIPAGIKTKTTLFPGVYCGGLEIGKDQDVILEPGEYIIKDGPLRVTSNGSFTGTGVGFYFTGPGSVFEFQAGTRISLEAPTSGALAGLLMFEDRNAAFSFKFNPLNLNKRAANVRLHRIQSDDARKLLGTIYLPRSILMVDSDSTVADQSAYTAILAGQLLLRAGPNLVLNADYLKTNVPVPSSLLGGEIVLSK
jgi:Flp pilus assembly protein TadG